MFTSPRSSSTWIPTAVAVGLLLSITLLARARSLEHVELVGGIIELSRVLHLDVVAEGIETIEQQRTSTSSVAGSRRATCRVRRRRGRSPLVRLARCRLP